MEFITKEPNKGDIIKVLISNNIYHFGIYLGNDEVIEYGSAKDFLKTNKSDVKVQISSMDSFLDGKNVLVAKLGLIEKMKRNSVNKTIELAKARLGETKYDPIENNCEHFVNECVFNKHYSAQAEVYKK